MNGSTRQALCDVLDEKEPAAATGTNEEGQSEDLAALLQGTCIHTISFLCCRVCFPGYILVRRRAAWPRSCFFPALSPQSQRGLHQRDRRHISHAAGASSRFCKVYMVSWVMQGARSMRLSHQALSHGQHVLLPWI